MKTKLNKRDFEQVKEVNRLQLKVDSQTEFNVESVSEEIFKHQPFFLSVLLGYRLETSPEELGEIMKIYFLTWEYFKSSPNVWNEPINKSYYEKIENNHIQMLKYIESESDPEEQQKIYLSYSQNVDSKALLATIFFRFKNRPFLNEMDERSKAVIILGIASFVECFEKISRKSTASQ